MTILQRLALREWLTSCPLLTLTSGLVRGGLLAAAIALAVPVNRLGNPYSRAAL